MSGNKGCSVTLLGNHGGKLASVARLEQVRRYSLVYYIKVAQDFVVACSAFGIVYCLPLG